MFLCRYDQNSDTDVSRNECDSLTQCVRKHVHINLNNSVYVHVYCDVAAETLRNSVNALSDFKARTRISFKTTTAERLVFVFLYLVRD